jgi:hypothetical protein
MSKKLLAILTVISITLIAFPAYAADSAAARIGQDVLEILKPILAALVGWVVFKLTRTFEAKTGIDVPQKYEDQVNAWVNQGIAYAEEKARQYVLAKGNTITGPEKLELALGFVLDLADQYKLTTYAKDKIVKKIEAMLGMSREVPAPAPTPEPVVEPVPVVETLPPEETVPPDPEPIV